MTAVVTLGRDEWWPWIYIEDLDLDAVTVEVSDAVAARWRKGLEDAERIQSEMYAAWVNGGGNP